MFTGPPLPLSLEISIQQLLALTHSRRSAGAWVRDAPRELRVRLTGPGRSARILVSRDLGLLLRRCAVIVLRKDSEPVVLRAEVLIRWRALQVVTGTPCLPGPGLLKEIFPEAYCDTTGFSVPITNLPPEGVLAECLTHGIPVAGSRIVYATNLSPNS